MEAAAFDRPTDREGTALEEYHDPTVAVARPITADAGSHAAPVTTHHYPILASGSADPCVLELGRKLGDVGFENSVSRGENPYGHVDPSIMAAVYAFRSQYGAEEDSSGFGGEHPAARSLAASHIGWRTWARLHEVHDQHQGEVHEAA